MASQEKITVHNLADLKNTSDDAIPNYLNSLKFKQNHTLVDTRLALGYTAFVIAGACFAWDYKFGFDNTKYYTAVAVAVYTVINTILTYWIAFVEKGIVYQGTTPKGDKNIPIYKMKITVTSKGGKPNHIELQKSFTEWFDAAGHFIVPPFQSMLATSVPLIATADPKRVAAAATAQDPTSDFVNMNQDVLNALAAGEDVGSATSADATSGKKSKRRKA
ncbi:signal peptidase complex subunit SPC2 [Apiospora hydei]|uniref:Signal peptidase complex subunit 2 n=1 Tax=Apiospora hydei TaxID=1337664 RepID=A0ABR1X0Y5_9PEZI